MKKTQTVKFNSLKTLALVAAGGLATQMASGQCVPPLPGLVAWWPGEGNGVDVVGGNNGELSGGANFGSGKVGQAFNFSNGFVTVPSSPSLNFTSAISIEGWIWIKLDAIDTAYFIATKQPSGTARNNFAGNYEFRIDPPGYLVLIHQTDTDEQYAAYSSTSILSPGGWHHVAVCLLSGGNVDFYVDGVPAGTSLQQGAFGITNSQPLRIGTRADGLTSFTGLIDELGIYNRALSSNEIAAIYAAGSAGKCSPLAITTQPHSQVGYWGKSVTFSVVATSLAPPMTYQWQHNSTPIQDATNAILVLAELQSTNAGTYTVVVSDFAGRTITSDPATLTVNTAGTAIALYAGVTIDGVVGLTYGVQSSLDLSNTNSWAGRANITLTTPTFLWYDSQPATQPQTYYRVVPGPISIP